MLKKFIRESFFNPVLHILPILLFLLLDDVSGSSLAWMVSSPVALLLAIYVFVFYRSIYRWHLTSIVVYLLIASLITVLNSVELSDPYTVVAAELVASAVLTILFLCRKTLNKFVLHVTSRKISMFNNLQELYRTSLIFAVIFLLFSVSFVMVYFWAEANRESSLEFVYQSYLSLLIIAVLYEFVRVFAIRGRLIRENWLPIVNEKGQEVGSIQYQNSMLGEMQKYRHPVVRVIVIEGNNIFLQKHAGVEAQHAAYWDNAISGHMHLTERVEDTIKRLSLGLYDVEDIKPVFLANYSLENHCEYQYVHLYITCRMNNIKPNPDYVEHVKWWTINQIKEELKSGIFTDNFLKEFDILLRSGLIDSGRCDCDCTLRDEIDKAIG